MHEDIPPSVIEAATGRAGAEVVDCRAQPIGTGTGAATATVTRLTGRARCGDGQYPFTLIRKAFRPLATGRHAAAATDERHWGYWRREPLAYASGLHFDARAVHLGYRTTLALTGASRIHWMLSRGMTVPPRYADFVVDQAQQIPSGA